MFVYVIFIDGRWLWKLTDANSYQMSLEVRDGYMSYESLEWYKLKKCLIKVYWVADQSLNQRASRRCWAKWLAHGN